MTEQQQTINLDTMGEVVGAIINGLGYQPRRVLILLSIRGRSPLSAYRIEYTSKHGHNVAPVVHSLVSEGAERAILIGFEDTEDESLAPAAEFLGELEVAGAVIPANSPYLTVRKGFVYQPLEDGVEPVPVDYSKNPFRSLAGMDGLAQSRSALLAQWQSIVDPAGVYPIGTDPSDGRVAEGAQVWAKVCRGEEVTTMEVAAAATAVNNVLFRTALVLRLAPESLPHALLTEQMRDYATTIDVPGDQESRVRGMRDLSKLLPDTVEASNALTVIGHYLWWSHMVDPALAVAERVERFRNTATLQLLSLIRNNISPERVATLIREALAETENEREE
jgi:hypothetical protein